MIIIQHSFSNGNSTQTPRARKMGTIFIQRKITDGGDEITKMRK
jgi:hypothetical protein